MNRLETCTKPHESENTPSTLQIIKFIDGKRTQIVEKMTSDSMDFPQVLFCTSRGFKTNVLTDIGLKANSMKFAQFSTYYQNIDLGDIEEIWENATYSMEEFALTWIFIDGIILLVKFIMNRIYEQVTYADRG